MVWPVWTKDGPPCIAHMNPTKTYSTPSFAAQLSLAHSSEIRSPLELITGKKKKVKTCAAVQGAAHAQGPQKQAVSREPTLSRN